MKRLRTILTLAVLTLWLPASSHELLESAGLIHQSQADHDPDSTGSHEDDTDGHDAADGNCILSSTDVHTAAPDAVTTAFPVIVLDLVRSSEHRVTLQPSGLAPPGTVPPQLCRRWQFSFRTALPPRAPSLIP